MTRLGPDPVVSGVPYRVTAVGDHAPSGLVEVVGEVTLVVEGHTGKHILIGCGTGTGEAVRFHEKGHGTNGKDVRVWRIREAPEGLVAETV
jgi:hypothetical protein